MKNSEIAEKAIEHLERDGWTRYRTGYYGFPSCVGGALMKSIDRWDFFFNANGWLYKICGPLLPTWLHVDYAAVPTFNDRILKSQEEAVQFLTDVAKYWRDKGE